MKHSETFYQNPAGNQTRPAKAGRQPEANIASSPVMAARSVWGERRSHVIEPRNNDCVGAFVVRQAGAAWIHRNGLVGKWLKAGVMEHGLLHEVDEGTPRGGVISPMPSNIFPHEVLDKWFAETVKPRLQGRAFLEGPGLR